jgi:hypothetical protein
LRSTASDSGFTTAARPLARQATIGDNYDPFVPRENDVRVTGQVASSERKAEAKPVKQGPDPALRPRILTVSSACGLAPSLFLRPS